MMNVFVISCDIGGKIHYHPTGSVNKSVAEIKVSQLNMSYMKICDEFDRIRFQYLNELNDVDANYFENKKLSDQRKVKQLSIEKKYRDLIADTIDSVIKIQSEYVKVYYNNLYDLMTSSASSVLTIGYHSLPRNFKLCQRYVTEEILAWESDSKI